MQLAKSLEAELGTELSAGLAIVFAETLESKARMRAFSKARASLIRALRASGVSTISCDASNPNCVRYADFNTKVVVPLDEETSLHFLRRSLGGQFLWDERLVGRCAARLKEWQVLFDAPNAGKWRDGILHEVYTRVGAYRGLASRGEATAESTKKFVEIVEAV